MRISEISRKTAETDISVRLCIDGEGKYSIESGVGFFDHMLSSFSKHSGFDLDVKCTGDTYVDFHHTVEDVGIVLGKAVKECLGDCKGIERFAYAMIPMDEALVISAVDVSGRGGAYITLDLQSNRVGDFDTELVYDFFESFAKEAGITLHIKQERGRNTHHIIEATFKSVARSLKYALRITSQGVPSTKGVIQ